MGKNDLKNKESILSPSQHLTASERFSSVGPFSGNQAINYPL